MKNPLPLLLALAAVGASAFAAAASPLAMAHALEARMAAGDGATLPDANAEVVRHAGTIDLARGEWPAAFLSRAGEAICVAVSPFTGNYEFFDGSGECFFTLVPALPTTENWVAPFRHAEEGAFPDDDLYAPWRLVDVWSLSNGRDAPTARPISHAESTEFVSHAEFAESAEFVSHAESAENAESLVTHHSSLVTRGAPSPATNLCFTAFSFTDTNLYFTAAWPTNEALPQSVLDLYGSTNLSSHWTFLSSHPATTNPVSFAVARASLPWGRASSPSEPHVHDASCVSLTNIVLSPLDGVTVYTNAFWSCSTNRTPGECGFFRLGTRHDTDGDGLFDAAELLVHGTRPDRLDSDGDGVPDGVSPSVWWSNPIWATNYLDADFSVEIVAPTDGSAETILAMDGLRIPLSPGAESDLDSWTARIAGHFDLRGIVPCGGFALTTAVQQIEVQFPSGAQIAADEEFISSAEWAWTLMTSEASEPPHAQREYGFCVFLDTSDQEYDCSDIQQGPFIPPYGNGEIAIDCYPVTDPDSPSPTASGARYAVATFHTHPPATYAFEGWYRPTGPSTNDVSNAMTRGLPSMVSDYIPFEGDNGKINGGHPLDAEHQRILIPNPVRRATP